MPSEIWTGSERDAESIINMMRKSGVATPRNPRQARLAGLRAGNMVAEGSLADDVKTATLRGQFASQRKTDSQTQALINDFSQRRRKTAMTGIGASDAVLSLPRVYDPEQSLEYAGIPTDLEDDKELARIRGWCRLLYTTHYIVPTCIDVYTRYPLAGLELTCKDKELQKFYEELFIDELDYPTYLTMLGREFWTAGEAFSLGSFNETLGIWEKEEILNPDDIRVVSIPFMKERGYRLTPPDYLREIVQNRHKYFEEYQLFQQEFPGVLEYVMSGKEIPVSGILLRHMFTQTWGWSTRGYPILMRALRTLMHEEKLNAAQDAVADRLYAPLLLAKLGTDKDIDGVPWIPDQGDLDQFRMDLEMALQSDFRALVYHYALDIETVFGKESVPRFDNELDRIERKLLLVFGINASLLSGGSNSQPYASTALQADFLNQQMSTYQHEMKMHFKERAEVVAEAQEHFDYEKSGESRIPIYEEWIEVDEFGNEYVREAPKLLVPELQFKTLNLRDEKEERRFLNELRGAGIPIANSTLMVNLPIDLEEEREKSVQEQIGVIVAEQEKIKKLFEILVHKKLPIPQDIIEQMRTIVPERFMKEPEKALEYLEQKIDSTGAAMPRVDSEGDNIPEIGDTEGAIFEQLSTESDADQAQGFAPENKIRQRPEISDERREEMPKAASMSAGPSHVGLREGIKPGDLGKGWHDKAIKKPLPQKRRTTANLQAAFVKFAEEVAEDFEDHKEANVKLAQTIVGERATITDVEMLAPYKKGEVVAVMGDDVYVKVSYKGGVTEGEMVELLAGKLSGVGGTYRLIVEQVSDNG